jgi:hypothetical protein
MIYLDKFDTFEDYKKEFIEIVISQNSLNTIYRSLILKKAYMNHIEVVPLLMTFEET